MYFCTFAGIDRLSGHLICLCLTVLFKCLATYVLDYNYFMLRNKKRGAILNSKWRIFFYLNITRLNNVHFSTNVVFPTDVVTGQIDYWTQFYNKLLQQAVVTVLKQFHLKNFLFYKSYFNSFTLLTYSVLIQLFQGSKGIRQWLIN